MKCDVSIDERNRRFVADFKRVHAVVKQWTLNTQGWEWVKKFDLNQDGRAAVNEMREHCDEPEATEKRLFKALAELKQIHCKSEHAYSFMGDQRGRQAHF